MTYYWLKIQLNHGNYFGFIGVHISICTDSSSFLGFTAGEMLHIWTTRYIMQTTLVLKRHRSFYGASIAQQDWPIIPKMDPSRLSLTLYHQHDFLSILLTLIQKPLIVAGKTKGKQSEELICSAWTRLCLNLYRTGCWSGEAHRNPITIFRRIKEYIWIP